MNDSNNDNDENFNENIVINGFANCVDQIHKIQKDEIMDNANLNLEQKKIVNNYKEKKDHR